MQYVILAYLYFLCIKGRAVNAGSSHTFFIE